MKIVKKHATIVSTDFILHDVEIGERVHFYHDDKNEYDKNAIHAVRAKTLEDIGFMTASPHTTLAGCSNNKEMFSYLPSKKVPLVGIVTHHERVSFKNGSIAPVLKVEMTVVIKDEAV